MPASPVEATTHAAVNSIRGPLDAGTLRAIHGKSIGQVQNTAPHLASSICHPLHSDLHIHVMQQKGT